MCERGPIAQWFCIHLHTIKEIRLWQGCVQDARERLKFVSAVLNNNFVCRLKKIPLMVVMYQWWWSEWEWKNTIVTISCGHGQRIVGKYLLGSSLELLHILPSEPTGVVQWELLFASQLQAPWSCSLKRNTLCRNSVHLCVYFLMAHYDKRIFLSLSVT